MSKRKICVLLIIFFITIMFSNKVWSLASYKKIRNREIYNIRINNVSEPNIIGNSKIIEEMKSSKDYMDGLKFTIAKSGDGVNYYFELENRGNIDAYIGDLHLTNPVCIYLGESNKLINAYVCNNLIYTLKYEDDNRDLEKGDMIDANTKRKVVLSIIFNASSNTNLDNRVLVSDISLAIDFVKKIY